MHFWGWSYNFISSFFFIFGFLCFILYFFVLCRVYHDNLFVCVESPVCFHFILFGVTSPISICSLVLCSSLSVIIFFFLFAQFPMYYVFCGVPCSSLHFLFVQFPVYPALVQSPVSISIFLAHLLANTVLILCFKKYLAFAFSYIN